MKRLLMFLKMKITLRCMILSISIEEDRYIAIGCIGDVLFVVFTERKENIRLVSARLANEAERRLYYDQNIHY